jgi:hypothetical protein
MRRIPKAAWVAIVLLGALVAAYGLYLGYPPLLVP